MNKGLKFLRGHEIRKVHKLPPNYASMQQTLYSLYGTTDLTLTYIDDNSIKHTISNDEDLINAYEVLKDKLNFKFIIEDSTNEPDDVLARIDFLRQSIADVSSLKPDLNFIKSEENSQAFSAPMIINESNPINIQPIENLEINNEHFEPTVVFQNTKCKECSIEPITGVLFRCTVCESTDLCEACEVKNIHLHPLVKYRNETNLNNFLGFSMKNIAKTFGKEFGKIMKEMKRKKYSVEIVQVFENDKVCGPGKAMVKGWQIRNNGTHKWPEKTKIVLKKGSLVNIENNTVISLSPGETANLEVNFMTPLEEGTHKSKWKLQIKPYKFIGNLSAKVKVLNLSDSKIESLKQLLKTGISIERAILSLS